MPLCPSGCPAESEGSRLSQSIMFLCKYKTVTWWMTQKSERMSSMQFRQKTIEALLLVRAGRHRAPRAPVRDQQHESLLQNGEAAPHEAAPEADGAATEAALEA